MSWDSILCPRKIMSDKVFKREILSTVIKVTVIAGVSCCVFSWLLKKLDPSNSKKAETAKKKANYQLKRIGKSQLKLTEYEKMIASHLVIPSDIDVGWKDIAGLQTILDEIAETVIFPIINSKLLANSKLTKPPKGVLLHGPPGCGKTLIAKATAKEAVTSFINLDVSILTDKWYGESQKLVSALFSLAEKLQPCIIFIDEIDSILRSRTSQDHEATAMMKAQFMFLWDGLATDPNKIVIVMGATNRPQDLDSAILRRMPASFRIPLPDKSQRIAILKLILQNENTTGINYDYLATKTEEFSGSDLQELCRVASLYRVKEYVKKKRSCSELEESESMELRPINMEDMEQSLNSMKISKLYYVSQFRDIKVE